MNTVKHTLLTILIGLSGNLFSQQAAEQKLPSILIGGIEASNIQLNQDILRSIIYKSLVHSKKYVVNDKFDVAERLAMDKLKNCMGKKCLEEVGQILGSDYAISASYEGLGDRILVAMKIVEVSTGKIVKNEIEQFENQPRELNRMTDIMLYRMLDIPFDAVAARALFFKDNPATSGGLGKMNNSGPRMGIALATGENAAYFTRDERDGGVGIKGLPVLFNIGYQLEKQYVGGETFSALFEFVGNVAGIEHGTPVPSLAILHGVRFGKGAWEIAMGPSLSCKQLLTGTTGYDGVFRTYGELSDMNVANPGQFYYSERPDTRGAMYFSTNFVFGIGKTFRPGALNVPLNAYASFNKFGASYGLSVGVNITRSKKYITTR